jgi:hypothetical protein
MQFGKHRFPALQLTLPVEMSDEVPFTFIRWCQLDPATVAVNRSFDVSRHQHIATAKENITVATFVFTGLNSLEFSITHLCGHLTAGQHSIVVIPECLKILHQFRGVLRRDIQSKLNEAVDGMAAEKFARRRGEGPDLPSTTAVA